MKNFPKPRLSPALWTLIAVSFLLPFATVSCDEAKTSFTGVQLVTHTVPDGGVVGTDECPGDIGDCAEGRGSFLAEVALGAALLGLALAQFRRRGEGWCATAGLLALLGLGVQAFDLYGPEITFRSGYWIALNLYTVAAVLHLVRRVRGSDEPASPTPYPPVRLRGS